MMRASGDRYSVLVEGAGGAVATPIAHYETRELAAAFLSGLWSGYWWRPARLAQQYRSDARVVVTYGGMRVLVVRLHDLGQPAIDVLLAHERPWPRPAGRAG